MPQQSLVQESLLQEYHRGQLPLPVRERFQCGLAELLLPPVQRVLQLDVLE